jgi:hypothetical protein
MKFHIMSGEITPIAAPVFAPFKDYPFGVSGC